MRVSSPEQCPCANERRYAACCARWHGGVPAPDADSLMRSRYSAYALGLADYLMATWHVSTRPTTLDLAEKPGERTIWLGLDVKSHRVIDENHAEVEFIARFRVGGGRASRLYERSRFVREDGRWFYFDGRFDWQA